MDIATSQIGQSFAVNSVGVSEGRNENSVPVSAEVTPPANVNTEIQRRNEQASQTQENARIADNKDSEQRNTTLEIEDASREIEQFLQAQNRNLAFTVDEGTKRSVVTVTEADSGDIIRQIPSEEVLRLAERLKDLQADVGSSVGVLFNNRA